ncbi:hypothetical protein C6502_09440 [Candidatus Poribacteria bacterium]|nr:MAG: hypothetical protein C6502_09440 [Candidatus Poribacteria bacterium]
MVAIAASEFMLEQACRANLGRSTAFIEVLLPQSVTSSVLYDPKIANVACNTPVPDPRAPAAIPEALNLDA